MTWTEFIFHVMIHFSFLGYTPTSINLRKINALKTKNQADFSKELPVEKVNVHLEGYIKTLA